MEQSQDTTNERERCASLLGKIIGHATAANVAALMRAIRDGRAVDNFTPPDANGALTTPVLQP